MNTAMIRRSLRVVAHTAANATGQPGPIDRHGHSPYAIYGARLGRGVRRHLARKQAWKAADDVRAELAHMADALHLLDEPRLREVGRAFALGLAYDTDLAARALITLVKYAHLLGAGCAVVAVQHAVAAFHAAGVARDAVVDLAHKFNEHLMTEAEMPNPSWLHIEINAGVEPLTAEHPQILVRCTRPTNGPNGLLEANQLIGPAI